MLLWVERYYGENQKHETDLLLLSVLTYISQVVDLVILQTVEHSELVEGCISFAPALEGVCVWLLVFSCCTNSFSHHVNF